MKQYLVIAAFFTGAAFLFSCKQASKQSIVKAKNKIQVIQPPSKSISVQLKGILRTRRSYSNIQFMDNEKEIDAYLAKQEKSDPELYAGLNKEDSIWVNRFKQLGYVKNYTFLIKKLKLQTKSNISLLTSSGDTVLFKFYKDTSNSQICFNSFFKHDSVNINTHAISLQNLDYFFVDIIPGGNKELVFFDDYYFMNGDNFYFQVYEIKIINPK